VDTAPVVSPLPPLDQAPALLARIVAQASEHNVPITAADYRYLGASAQRPGAYEMVFDLEGEYRDAREFLQDVLEDQPSVALGEVAFVRGSAPSTGAPRHDPTAVQVHVRLTLFLRDSE
jgi:hypothetical protein